MRPLYALWGTPFISDRVLYGPEGLSGLEGAGSCPSALKRLTHYQERVRRCQRSG